jgi:cell division protein FtsL
MLRFVNVCLLLGLIALAYVNYEVKYQSRGVDHDIAQLNRQIEKERDNIAVLRAEWSLLNRPDRIEKLAKQFLNLQEVTPQQLLTLDSVTQQEFDQKVATAAPAIPDVPPPHDVPNSVKLLLQSE